MNLSVAPSEARRSKLRLATFEAKHRQLAQEVEDQIGCILVAELERVLLPANDGYGGYDPRNMGM